MERILFVQITSCMGNGEGDVVLYGLDNKGMVWAYEPGSVPHKYEKKRPTSQIAAKEVTGVNWIPGHTEGWIPLANTQSTLIYDRDDPDFNKHM